MTSLAFHRQIGPFWCWFLGEWVCVHSRTLGSLLWTLLWGWEFLLLLQPPQVFTARVFEALVSCSGTLVCAVYLVPQLFILAYAHTNGGLLHPPATTSPIHQPSHCLPRSSCWHESSLLILPISAPPTSLDECFFFNSLIVRLPYSSIFWQLRWFLFLNLLSFFWLYEEAKHSFLCLHLGWKSPRVIMLKFITQIKSSFAWKKCKNYILS